MLLSSQPVAGPEPNSSEVTTRHLARHDDERCGPVQDLGPTDQCSVGRGIGTALISELVDMADNWLDIRRLELNVYTDNSVAIRLYEKFGFRREGVFVGYAYREGAYVDSLAMARLRA